MNEETCVRAEVIPANNKSMLDCNQARCIMHFPTQPDYEFRFWEEEISFRPEELVGLTKRGADDLYAAKDIAYIQGH